MKTVTTKKSKKLFERALKVLPGGVSSVSRSHLEGYTPYPLFISRAEGSKLYDVDGNEYIDYLQALGPTLVGNANPRVVDFVAKEIKKGNTYALPYELQIEVAEKLIRDVPCFEKVSFMNSGTEVDQIALRLARAYTKKDLIVKFEGAYHGWVDSVAHSVHPSLSGVKDSRSTQEKMPIGAGIPENSYKDWIVLPWNNVEVLEETIEKRKDEIAAVIIDPCMCNSGVIPPEEDFLQAMRELTAKKGIVFIFDEVITGFRLALGGAQEKFGVIPDLATCAKAVGGGFPVSVCGGKAAIMDLLADGTVFRAGTVNANRVATSAAYATLEILEEDNGRVYKEIYRVGEKLMSGVKEIFEREQIEAILQGFGCMFQIHFTHLKKIKDYRDFCQSSGETYISFRNKLLDRGIFIRPSHFGELYISAAHTDEDIEKTLTAMEDALKEMKREHVV
jgi:glutamate-1-semialdehyde 2,1-aminomutase